MSGTWTRLARRVRRDRVSRLAAAFLLVVGYGAYALWPKSLTTEPVLYGDPVYDQGWALRLRSGQTLMLDEIQADDPLIVSGDGHTIVYVLDGWVRARDLRDGTVHDLASADRLTGLQTSFDGQDVAVSFRDRTLIADLRTGERRTIADICKVYGLSATVVWGVPGCERHGEEARLVTVRRDGTGAFVGKLSGGLVSPDLRLVASYDFDGVLISDAISGEKVKLINRENPSIIAWFNAHEVIVEGSPYQLIDVRTGGKRHDPALPDKWIAYIAWPGAGNDWLG
ncbi:hypothetical protein [Microtetraspora malaysiensis]|uniref:Glutaminyl-peptide cyclotransferase n=1 Tax=Microtetraspora malaysiensis TaxID=161358 RepID=A0ABW6SKV3_9ACTN